MGLIKNFELSNGININYHRITSLNIIVNEQVIIEVSSYISKEKREEEQKALKQARKSGEYTDTDIFIDTKYINVDYNPDMNVNKAYELLKTMEEFKNSEDDI